jgi:nanoRNase/pAp phosphatase (c-di-AMP/oligoRNAs hydrolase)
VVNGPFFTTSEVGAELAKTHDVALIWSIRKDGKMSVGLRSQGDIDVSKIAQKFGGGGHKNSAGFEVEARFGLSMFKSIITAGPFPTERSPGGCIQ